MSVESPRSIRVYAAKPGKYPVRDSVKSLLDMEEHVNLTSEAFKEFKARVVLSKLQLHALLLEMKLRGDRIYGIGAPSRASTLINYVGIDDGILQCVLEVKDSLKVGKYMPGTLIPVLEESRLFEDQPEYALLLSWHIADELLPQPNQQGF